jgi:hypothetical protein
MQRLIRPALAVVLIGVVTGFLLGAAIGFYLLPVSYKDTDFANLSPTQKDDWVVMVSAAYALDNNVDDAKQRIYHIDSDTAAAGRYVAQLAQRAIDRNDTRIARSVSVLAMALGVDTPSIRTYLQTTPKSIPASR